MKFDWNDIQKYCGERLRFLDGDAETWLHTMWFIVEGEKLNEIDNAADCIQVYSLLIGLIKVYNGFVNAHDGFNNSIEPFDVELDLTPITSVDGDNEENDDDYLEQRTRLLNQIIFGETELTAFKWLKQKMKLSTLYASLYYYLCGYCTENLSYGNDNNRDDYIDDVSIDIARETQRWINPNKEDEELINSIINDASYGANMSAYTWLGEQM